MAYNVITLIDQYLGRNSEKKRFKELLIGEQVSDSVVGSFGFDEHGALRMTNYLGRYQDGQLVPFE